jgi:hypothetical protein
MNPDSLTKTISNAILTLKDAGNDGSIGHFRAYIQGLDKDGDSVWQIGDSWNGGNNLRFNAQWEAADIDLITKSSNGGKITFQPRASTSFCLTDDGNATFSGSVKLIDDKTLTFGTDDNATIEYDENGTDELRFAGADVVFEQAVSVKHGSSNGILNIDSAGGAYDSSLQLNAAGTNTWQIKQDGSEDNNFVIRDYGAADVVTIARGSGTGKLVINSTGVGIGYASGSGPGTLLQINGTAPYLTLQNSTSENGAGGCESKIIFEDHGNNALGQIEVSHVGTSDDEKGQMIFKTNNDSGLQTALTISEAQLASFAGSVTLGDAATDVTTVTGHLTASNGMVVSGHITANDGVTTISSDLTASNGINIPDDQFLRFGDTDFTMEYDESGNNYLLWTNDGNSAKGIIMKNNTAGANASSNLYIRANQGGGAIRMSDDAVSTEYGNKFAMLTDDISGLDLALMARNSAAEIQFYTAGDGASNKRAVITAAGDLEIGGPAKSSGKRLHVLEAAAGYTAVFESPTGPGLQLSSSTDNDNQADWLIQGLGQATDGLGGRIRLYSGAASKEMFFLTATGSNISIGQDALSLIEVGATNNIAIGKDAGNDLTTGDNNVFIGYEAGDKTADADRSVIIGANAAGAVMTSDADGTIAIGYTAAAALTDGRYNTAVGYEAMLTDVQGDQSTALGYQALKAQTGVNGEVNNTAVGFKAGTAVTTGSYNVAVGSMALLAETGGSGSVAVGAAALYTQNYVASNNLYLWGGDAGYMNNTAVGYSAGYGITTGSHNTAIGAGALITQTVAHGVTAIGANTLALYNPITWADDDVYSGTYYRPSAGTTAIGENAGYNVSTGLDNTFVGNEAAAGTNGQGLTGNYNVCVGAYSGNKLQTNAGGNVIIGAYAGYSLMGNGGAITTGDNNILIGSLSDASAGTAQGEIVIGYNIVGTADKLSFGKNGSVITSSDYDTGTVAWAQSSDIRKKRNVLDDGLGLDFINKLRNVTFSWRPQDEYPKEWNDYSEENSIDTEKVHHGLIAQEVKAALDECGANTFDVWSEDNDGMQRLANGKLVLPLIKAVQELSAKVAELEAKLENQ